MCLSRPKRAGLGERLANPQNCPTLEADDRATGRIRPTPLGRAEVAARSTPTYPASSDKSGTRPVPITSP
jgi:hypothetical protein